MGRKSGRNGAPAPQSRVSLSESKPRDQFSLLELRTEFLAGCFSGFAVDLSALECALAQICMRALREPRRNLRAIEGQLCRRFRNWYEWAVKKFRSKPSR